MQIVSTQKGEIANHAGRLFLCMELTMQCEPCESVALVNSAGNGQSKPTAVHTGCKHSTQCHLQLYHSKCHV